MKKTFLTLTAALLASSSVFAADITSPFYQPAKGGFLSDTNAMYQNTANGNHAVTNGNGDDIFASETLTYGITRKFAVTGTLADVWKLEGRPKKYDNWSNPAYSVGVRYNLIDCERSKLKVQLGADYTQGAYSFTPFLSAGALFNHRVKTFDGFVKVGYDAGKTFLPYVTASILKPIGEYEQKPYYTGRAGLYNYFTKVISTDFGVSYTYSSDAGKAEGKHLKIFGLDTGINFKLTDAMSIGLTGSYVIDMKPADRDYYTVGANFKIAF